MLAALANPRRLRILARLAGGRDYVSHLAREIGISRPLLHLHLQRLEAAGLVVGSLELSEDGKAMKFYEVTDFDLHLSAAALVEAAKTLTSADPAQGPATNEDSWCTSDSGRRRRQGSGLSDLEGRGQLGG